MRALAEQGACEWTQAPNATSNGGDASRVGKRCSICPLLWLFGEK